MKSSSFVVALALFLLCACNSMPVEAAGKPGLDYAALGGWDWTEAECPGGEPSHLLAGDGAEVAREAVRAALLTQGRLRDIENPTFLLAVYACRMQRLTADSPLGIFSEGVRHTRQDTRTRRVEEDILFVDVLDPTSRELLWRATAANHIDEDMDLEDKHQLVRETVTEMAGEFPLLPED